MVLVDGLVLGAMVSGAGTLVAGLFILGWVWAESGLAEDLGLLRRAGNRVLLGLLWQEVWRKSAVSALASAAAVLVLSEAIVSEGALGMDAWQVLGAALVAVSSGMFVWQLGCLVWLVVMLFREAAAGRDPGRRRGAGGG